jgi:hypothetical protein
MKFKIAGYWPGLVLLPALLAARPASGAGVTIITHGLDGNVDGWITSMAEAIPEYYRFAGTNFTCYEMYFVPSGPNYLLTSTRVSGSPPAVPESGEIIIKLDWRQLADGNSYNTFQIANMVAPALLSTNFIAELGGHALAELPLHLVGHSRGGSLMCELSRLLGTNGVWVDQITTLDPHPLNDPDFPLDQFAYSAVDAPVHTYANVLFHDNNWQDAGSFVWGKAVAGAYVRKLTSFSGGYSGGLSSEHSDVHLWYHGTIDTNTPASYVEDSVTITITSAMRTNWWNAYESRGAVAGFNYSLIAGGNRLSPDRPLGAGSPAIVEGFNSLWDLGAGTLSNRTTLTTNFGNWPNLIRLNRTATNAVVQGQSTPLRLYYQWARPVASNALVSLYLDDDSNPLNTNQVLIKELALPGTGASAVGLLVTNVVLYSSNAPPGGHNLFARISGAGRTRFLYAPETLAVVALLQPPVLDITRPGGSQFQVGVNGLAGQTVVLQNSTNLQFWLPLATNTLTSNRWVYTNPPPADAAPRFYRAVVSP